MQVRSGSAIEQEHAHCRPRPDSRLQGRATRASRGTLATSARGNRELYWEIARTANLTTCPGDSVRIGEFELGNHF